MEHTANPAVGSIAVVLAAMLSVLAFAAAPALAAAPEAPTLVVEAPVRASEATVRGVLNPGKEGEPGTFETGTYQFLYKASKTKECEGGSVAPASPGISLGGGKEGVSEVLASLAAETEYAVCLEVETASGGRTMSAPVTFTTLAVAPIIEESSVTNVASSSATLTARIDPRGSETTYRFEYGTSAAYGSSIPVPDGLVGSGATPVSVTAHPQDLSPSTEYHYRVVALVASRSEAVPGSDGTFTTQPSGSELALPDGRQWELVTPPNKHGAMIQSLGVPGPIQAAEDGAGITYGTSVPTESEPSGYGQAGEFQVQALSRRGAQGWSTRDIGIPHEVAAGFTVPPEYQFFSPDLTPALAFPESNYEEPLSSDATEQTPYIRREALCDAPASASECYLPILTGKEGFADVPPGTKFGGAREPGGGDTEVAFEGASPDLSRVVISFQGNTFEWSAGEPPSEELQPVSVLPAGEGGGMAPSPSVGGSLGYGFNGNRHSISDDGSRVFWMSGTALYMRDMLKRETVRLDVPQPGVPSGQPEAYFQIASSDGSKVFFTDIDQYERLTAQSGAGGRDLYECEIVEEAGKLACRLTDLTPETNGQSAGVRQSVLGASEDGSYVYFVATGVLSEVENGEHQKAAPGADNLYMEHYDSETKEWETPSFIAMLSSIDYQDWGEYSNMAVMTARVSPDGRYLTFMSSGSLTGYDNRDALSGRPDQEVYLYDAVSGRLVCASCSPTGDRPNGVEVRQFTIFGDEERPNIVAVKGGAGAFDETNWVAANIAPSDDLQGNGALYQPRVLSDGGRLFFNTVDALVPQDVNGQEDVYEYEPEGMGSCTASSVTFSSRSGGCVALISSGSSPEESGFLDASVSGGDVFFLTAAKLVMQDYDTSYDVYDAHECSAASPCVTQPVSSPPCSSGDSCKAAPSPQPSIYGAPASATFTGAGNIIPEAAGAKVEAKAARCARGRVRRHGRCVKAKRRKGKVGGKAKMSSGRSGR